MSREAMQQALQALEQCGLDDSRRDYTKESEAITALRAALAEQAQQQVAWAYECRLSLVTALYSLASDFENALYKFKGDDEALHSANGSIAHARKVAAQWGWNGATPPAPQPLTERDLELLDGMIEVQLHHAAQCDLMLARAGGNHIMAERQKGWDMERVELLRKIKRMGVQR